MKSSLRGFGIGLFLVGMCLALLNQFDLLPTDDKSTTYKEEIKSLKKELAQLKVTAEEAPIPAAQAEKQEKPAVEAPVQDASIPNELTTATIFIYEGMSIYEIGQQVEGEGIVTNGREVELYLSRPEYARSIQKGAFDLRSDMTVDEIANILTGKPLTP